MTVSRIGRMPWRRAVRLFESSGRRLHNHCVELAKQAGAVDVQAVSDLLVLKCQVKGETVELAAFSPFSTASDTLRRSVGRVATV